MIATFEIPVAMASANRLLRQHWSRRSRDQGALLLLVRSALVRARRAHMPLPSGDVHVGVRCTRVGVRRLDADNLALAHKPLVDVLVTEGLLRDDSPRWATLAWDQRLAHGGPCQTLVELTW